MTQGTDISGMSLRACTPTEYPAFEARSRQEYAEEIHRNGVGTLEAARAKADADLARLLPDGIDSVDQHILTVVDGNGDQVGSIWIGMKDGVDGPEAFGYDFWIRPELRDAGLGRRAMELAADHARTLGAVRLGLNVFGDNERALHLYRSFGFQVTSVNMAMQL
ncbi:MAG: family N-acetyltransferase [Thermoleophilia bacterium]|nr:family N-acetyltransferase [Thermoleophilia bacterium]